MSTSSTFMIFDLKLFENTSRSLVVNFLRLFQYTAIELVKPNDADR